MAEIAQKIFSLDGTKNLLRLYQEEFVRPISVGSWVRLRLIISCAVTDTGGNIPAVSAFFGFCFSDSSPWADPSCVYACGVEFASATWTRGGTTNPYYTVGTANARKKVAGVAAGNSISVANMVIAATGGALQRRSYLTVDLTVAGDTIALGTGSTASAILDMPQNYFVAATETVPSAYAGSAYVSASATSGAANATPLNNVNIYWGAGLAPLEIYAMSVYKYYI